MKPVARRWLVVAFVLAAVARTMAQQEVLGWFAPRPAVTVYIVNDGAPVTATLSVRPLARDSDRWMIRAFDGDERLGFWRYIEPASAPFEQAIPLQNRGVHQIRVTAGASRSVATVSLPAARGWGVSFQNGPFSPWKNQPATMYAFVPPHAEELKVKGGPVRISDENGKELLRTASKDEPTQTIVVAKTDVVWRFEFPQPAKWEFQAAGLPLILCPTPEAARAIRASVEVLPDGTVVCHKFQRRMAELLPKLLDPKNVGAAEKLIVPLATRKDAWLKDPLRNGILLESYGMFPVIAPALRAQNVDPSSHWAGSLSGWQERMKLTPPQNRWDRLKSVPPLPGVPTRIAAAGNLAQAALLDAPFNPYFGKRELLYRAAAAAFQHLMTLGEDEIFRNIGADFDLWPGLMAFSMDFKACPPFALAAPQMSPEVRAVWTEGLRHVVDRQLPDELVSARNQSAHAVMAFQYFAEGSGDPQYHELARMFARRFVAGQHPAGFHPEGGGLDATYTGLTHYQGAIYYRHSKDPLLLESLRRSYYFNNHTVAPEPDGKMLGGFNFAHRTGDGFHWEQSGGARGILDDVLPEVGLWAGPEPTAAELAERKRKAAADIVQRLAAMPAPQDLPYTTPRYLFWSKPNRADVWPALEAKSFTRDFAGQLVAVKRPAYYAAIYVGKPAPGQFFIRGGEGLRLPLPDDAENRGAVTDPKRGIAPFLGGGLTLFWTPAYGSAVLAANWSPLTHHGLVTTVADGKRYWEDYFSTRYHLDAQAGTLEISGRVESQPIAYTRTYRFSDDKVDVRVTLTAEADMTLTGLFENVPIARGKAKAHGAELAASGNRFDVRDKDGKGVEFVLDQPRPLRPQPNGLQSHYRDLQIGRVEIELPANLAAKQQAVLAYTVRPIR